MAADAFQDLAGNTLSADIGRPGTASTYEFTISIDQYDVLSVKFDEVVQKGTGKITIYSGTGCNAGCSAGTILMESDISSLPLMNYADTAKAKSSLVIAPGKM